MGIARTIARNTTFEFITNVSELGISFVVGIILTRGLGTEQYGLYAYAMWLSVLAGLVNNLGSGDMIRRFIPEAIGRQSTHEPVGFVQLTLLLRMTASLAVFFALLISSGYWVQQSGDPGNRLIFIILAFSTLPDAFQQTLVSIFKGFQKFNYSLIVSLAMYPLRLVLIMICMKLGFGVLTVLLINIATLTLGILVSLYLLRRFVTLKSLLSPSHLSSDRKKQALRYSLTVAGTLLLGYLVSQQAGTFFIGMYCSVEDVGFYSLAFRIGTIVAVLPSAFNFVLLPAITEQFGKGDMEKINRIYLDSLRYLMMLALPLAVGGIALAGPIITTLFGTDYSPAVILFQIISLPIAFSGLNGISNAVIRGINRPGFLLVTGSIFAIVNVGLSLWLTPRYGVLGAAIASSITIVLTLLVYMNFVCKKIGVTWPWGDTIKIATASLIMGLVIYVLQSHFSAALSLALCIPLGIIIYIISILALKVIQEQDLAIFKAIQYSLPLALRKYYIPFMKFAEKIVLRTKLSNGR